MPQSSLRTALQQLESMASYKAARIMDKLNAGLQKVTSHRVFDGVLRQGTVGREVSANLQHATSKCFSAARLAARWAIEFLSAMQALPA